MGTFLEILNYIYNIRKVFNSESERLGQRNWDQYV